MALNGRGVFGALLAIPVLLALGWLPANADAAEFGIAPDGFSVHMLDAEGHPENRAGAHPDRLQIHFALTVEATGTTARDISIELPPGLGGNLNAVPDCPRGPYEEGIECPAETQVGVARFGSSETSLPIFQLEPEPGQAAAFATKQGFPLPLTMTLRPDDFGAVFQASNPEQVAISEGEMELWGVPADHQKGTAIPRRAFLTTPSRCGPLSFALRVRSWQEGAPWLSTSAETEEPLQDCESLGFGPSLHVQLGNPVSDSPTGMRMEISTPEEEDPSHRANAQIRDVTVDMPPGVTVSPRGAVGIAPCSDAQFGLGKSGEPACPPTAKVGTVEIASPGISEAFRGTIYMGEERPGERLRLLIAAPGGGTFLKFTSSLHADPATGRLSTELHDLPQVAVERLSLSIDGGSKALLASPLSCGPTSARARFTPYGGGPARESQSSLLVNGRSPGGKCTGGPPFAPELLAGSSDPRAGRPTGFWTILRRRDGEQMPRRFALALPPGLSASVGSMPACSADELPDACPAASRVGSALLEVGSGPEPVPLQGDVYLTGPYRRAPFGLLIAFKARIGPIDLGSMDVRAGLQIDGRTGRVTVSSDQLPDLVEGVTVRFQRLELNLERRGLIRNPTSCGRSGLDGSIESQSGALATATSSYAVKGCKKLGFEPRIRMAFEGRARHAQTRLGLRLSTRLRPGDANLKALRISLPPELRLSASATEEICSRQDAANGTCPAGSRIGTSSARTPMLDEPLRGSIFAVRPKKGSGLPDIWISLEARGIHAELRGTGSARKGHFVTTLAGLPDMPISAITMRIGSAKDGAFSLATDPCAPTRRRDFAATVLAAGQNGRERRLRVGIATGASCSAHSRAPR